MREKNITKNTVEGDKRRGWNTTKLMGDVKKEGNKKNKGTRMNQKSLGQNRYSGPVYWKGHTE